MQAENKTSNSVDWCKIAERHIPNLTSCEVFRILEDTTDYFEVDYGDVMVLNKVGYLVRGTESEKKFGLEGERKPWVKSCVDLTTGDRKVIKLTFHEEFACRIEGLKFTCLRNPEKEARILDKIRDHKGFMQGFHVYDAAGNNVRIIDRIPGRSLDIVVRSIQADHKTYYHEHLPALLKNLAEAFANMADLHEHGEIHGDITPDHIHVEKETGDFIWIDFDYDYKETNDLFVRDVYEMGTLLAFVVGKDYLSLSEIRSKHPEISERLRPEDMQSVFPNQLANLKLVHPYIDDRLNAVLMSFAKGSNDRYERAQRLADDLASVAAGMLQTHV